MENIAVIALVILLVLLFRWLGRPVRRLPHEAQQPQKKHPEEDVPPPTMMS